MIAKIISHGPTREEAWRKLSNGLADTVALGVTTNQAFLSRCLSHPVFASGDATTAFIADNSDALLKIDVEIEHRAAAIAAMLLQVTASNRTFSTNERGWAHSFPIPMRLEINGSVRSVRLTANKLDRFAVDVDDRALDLQLIDIEADTARFICDGVADRAMFHRAGTRLALQYAGCSFVIDDRTLAPATRPQEKSGDGKVRAAMNGRVEALLVAAGDSVGAGQPMIVIEAMKMEQAHRAPVLGKVASIHVAINDQVAARRVIAEVDAVDS